MLYLTQNTNILLAIEPVDFRCQIDGLASLCEHHLFQDPRSGQLFVFINRAKTMLRVLCYEDNGYWLATKRLSRGRFKLWPSREDELSHRILAQELTTILKNKVAKNNEKS